MNLDQQSSDDLDAWAQWWSEVGMWEELRKQWEESDTELSFEEWLRS